MSVNPNCWFKKIIFITITVLSSFLCSVFSLNRYVSVVAETDTEIQSTAAVDLQELTGTSVRSDSVAKNLIGSYAYNGAFTFTCRVLLNEKDDYSAIGILQSQSNVYSDNGYYLVFNDHEMGLVKGAFGNGQDVSFECKTSVSEIDWLDPYGVILEFGAADVYEGATKTCVRVSVSLNGKELLSYDDEELREFGGYVVASTYQKAVLTTAATLTADAVVQEDLHNVTGKIKRERYATGVCLGQSSVDSNYEFRSRIRMYRGEEAVPIGILQSRADTWSGNGFYLIIDEEYGLRIADNAYGNSEQGGEQDIASKNVRATYGPVDSLYEDGGGELRFGAQYVRLGEDIAYTYVYAYLDGERVLAWYCAEVKPKGRYVIANTYACCVMDTTRPLRTVSIGNGDGKVSVAAGATAFTDSDEYFPLEVQVGYVVTSVRVDGQPLTFEETETGVSVFLPKTVLGENVTLDVETEEKKVVVSLPKDECRYWVNNGEETQLGYRQALALTIVPPVGKKIVSFQVNGVEKLLSLTEENGKYFYIEQALRQDITVSATLADKVYSVQTTCGDGGKVTSSSAQVTHGGSVKFTVVADEGYTVDTVTLNGETAVLDENGELEVSDCTQSVLLEVSFKKIKADIVGCASSVNGCVISLAVLICVTASYFLFVKKRKY